MNRTTITITIPEPTTEAALIWLKTRGYRSQMPGAQRMMTKAAEELEYRVPKKPVTINNHFGGQFLPGCPSCEYIIEDEDYCPKCGQAIDWGNEHED